MHNSSDTLRSFANLDFGRGARTGIPEAVFGESKTVEQIVKSLKAFVNHSGHGLATRVDETSVEKIEEPLGPDVIATWHKRAKLLEVRSEDHTVQPTGGRVAVFAAGTSDLPVADEAAITAGCMGCEVMPFYDVGIAGIHRLLEPVERVLKHDIHIVIAVAGMEGALPSVLRGLLPVPVIGVPTSVGYGYGGKGEGALMTMLQSCSPGLTVVNIDNGFGAGSTAALIANMVAQHKEKEQE